MRPRKPARSDSHLRITPTVADTSAHRAICGTHAVAAAML
jgi:hypothetical protein